MSEGSIVGGSTAEEPLAFEIEATIDGYRPRTGVAPERWPHLAEPTRQAVRKARPGSPTEARVLMWCVLAFHIWAEDMGLALDPALLFTSANIDRFCGMRAGDRERAGRRSHLRRIGRMVAPDRWPAPEPVFTRRSQAAPYSAEDIEGLFAAARQLPTLLLRTFLNNLLVLGVGCGIVGSEVVRIVGDDVYMLGDAVVVSVNGRAVPCRWEYEEALWNAARAVGAGPLVGRRLDRRIEAVRVKLRQAGSDLTVSSNRLRLTWLVHQLRAGAPIPVVLKGAGVTSMHAVERCLPFLDQIGDESYVSWLRGDRP